MKVLNVKHIDYRQGDSNDEHFVIFTLNHHTKLTILISWDELPKYVIMDCFIHVGSNESIPSQTIVWKDSDWIDRLEPSHISRDVWEDIIETKVLALLYKAKVAYPPLEVISMLKLITRTIVKTFPIATAEA